MIILFALIGIQAILNLYFYKVLRNTQSNRLPAIPIPGAGWPIDPNSLTAEAVEQMPIRFMSIEQLNSFTSKDLKPTRSILKKARATKQTSSPQQEELPTTQFEGKTSKRDGASRDPRP